METVFLLGRAHPLLHPCSLAYLVLDIPLLLLLPDCNHVGGNAGYVVFLVVLTEVRTLHEARVSLTFACS